MFCFMLYRIFISIYTLLTVAIYFDIWGNNLSQIKHMNLFQLLFQLFLCVSAFLVAMHLSCIENWTFSIPSHP